MINKLLEVLSNMISDNLGDSYKVYTEPLKEQATAPYFYIKCTDVKQKFIKKNRYRRENAIDIVYIASSDFAPVYETNEVVEELFDLLEVIEFEGQKIEASEMQSILEEDVVHFKVQYAFELCICEEKTDYMGAISWKGLKQ